MRKIIVLVCSATLIIGMIGIAGASPFTDVKYLCKWSSGTVYYPWENDAPHDFGDPNSVVISGNPGMPAWFVSDVNTSIFFSGKASGSINKVSWRTSVDGWTSFGIEDVLIDWNAENPLEISPAKKNMKRSKLLSSIFLTNYSNSSAPTPEPANLLILGFILIGVSFLGRKKSTPKTHRP